MRAALRWLHLAVLTAYLAGTPWLPLSLFVIAWWLYRLLLARLRERELRLPPQHRADPDARRLTAIRLADLLPPVWGSAARRIR